jgi:hypothetical protein
MKQIETNQGSDHHTRYNDQHAEGQYLKVVTYGDGEPLLVVRKHGDNQRLASAVVLTRKQTRHLRRALRADLREAASRDDG